MPGANLQDLIKGSFRPTLAHHWCSHRKQFEVQYFARSGGGRGGAVGRTPDLLISEQLALPPESQLPKN